MVKKNRNMKQYSAFRRSFRKWFNTWTPDATKAKIKSADGITTAYLFKGNKFLTQMSISGYEAYSKWILRDYL